MGRVPAPEGPRGRAGELGLYPKGKREPREAIEERDPCCLCVRCFWGGGWDPLPGDTGGQEEGGVLVHICEGPWPAAQWTWTRR